MNDKSDEQIVADAKAQAAQPQQAASAGSMVEVAVTLREVVAALTRTVVAQREDVAAVVGTMIASRQLYAMAYKELGLVVEAITAKERRSLVEQVVAEMKSPPTEAVNPDDVFNLLEEMLIQSSAYGASKPFDENVLFRGLRETVLPWMVNTVDRHNALAAEERKQAFDKWEEARRARPIPLAYRCGEPDQAKALPRDNSLVLFGWRPAVLWVMDQLVSCILGSRDAQLFTVIRLLTHATHTNPQPHLLRLGGKDWEDCCKSGSSWPKLFQRKLLAQLTDPPDVLVVDDLAHAGRSTSLFGGSLPRQAGNAQKRFRDWCNKVGSGLIGGVLLPDKELTYPAGPEWEQLRTFTTLRAVWVREEETKYHIMLGRDVLCHVVDKAVLDTHGSTLIVPGGKEGIV